MDDQGEGGGGGYFCGEGGWERGGQAEGRGIGVILGPIWQTPFLLILISWHNLPATASVIN